MTDTIRRATRTLTEEMLTLNQTATDWQLAQNKRAQAQSESAFEATRTTINTIAQLQRDATRAWLDLLAPVPTEA